MAPTLNVDLMKGLIAEQTVLKLNKLNSTSPIPKSNGKVSVGMDPVGDDPSGDNPNYNSIHPPHVYFILDPVSSSMRTYIMNFIPDSEASGFGQGGSWTGKLYEWNTSSDTVLVQQFSNNVLTSRTVSIFPHVDENGGITFSKPEKIQSLGPLKDKQVGGIFGWLADKILDGLGAIGYLFGLTELVPSTSGSTGHHMHYRFISRPGDSDGTSWGNSGESSSQYVTMGLPAIGTYLTGISSGPSYTEVTLSSYNYSGVNAYHGGPNNMVPNAAGIELLEYINVSESAQGYILDVAANPVATVLLDFVNAQGKSTQSKSLASLAVEIVTAHPEVVAAIISDTQNLTSPDKIYQLRELLDIYNEFDKLGVDIDKSTLNPLDDDWLARMIQLHQRLAALTLLPGMATKEAMKLNMELKAMNALIKVAGAVYPQVLNDVSESDKQSQFQNNAEHTVSILLIEFALGIGPKHRNFGLSNPITQKYLQGGNKQKLITEFNARLAAKNLDYDNFKAQNIPIVGRMDYSPDHAGVFESIKSHVNSDLARFFISGADVTFTPTSDYGWVDVDIYNETTWRSLFLHFGSNYPRIDGQTNRPLSTISQSYKFRLKIN